MFIEDYLSYIGSVRRFSKRTCKSYSDILNSFFAYCDPSDGSDIQSWFNRDSVRNFEVHLLDEKGESSRTVNLKLSALSSFARYLVRCHILKSNPVALVKRPKQEKRLPVFFRNESMNEYFECTKGVMEFGCFKDKTGRMIVSLLYSTGLRRSELVSLTQDSCDFSRKVLRVTGKGDKMREIPLTETIILELSLYLNSAREELGFLPDASDPLICTVKGKALYPVYIDKVIKEELAKVSSITGRKSPHVLRHTLATELLDNGADLNSIKELLGHSSLAATQVYTHNSIEKLKKVYMNAHPRAKTDKED